MDNLVYLFKGGSVMEREISIFDVANTFLSFEPMTHKKLQKICYYAQAWHLALLDEPIFNERFEAWVHGPVCRKLYDVYKKYGWNSIETPEVGSCIEDDETLSFLRTVYNTYGGFDGDELEALTHSEAPWRKARGDLEEWEPSNECISEEIMKEFYSAVYEQTQND